MTARDLIVRSFRFVHITGDGEEPTASEINDGLLVLNELIEQPAIDKLLAFFQAEIVIPMVPNQQSYTIGPSSTVPDVIVSARPVEIISGFSRRQNVDLPIYVAAKQDYDQISVKNISVAGWESVVYYQASFPKGTLFFYMVPLDNLTTVHLTVAEQLAPFTSLNDEIILPPGYSQWLRYTLGRNLAPEFGMTFTEDMKDLQENAEVLLKRNNTKPMPISGSDTALLSTRGPGGYNVYSDTNRQGGQG